VLKTVALLLWLAIGVLTMPAAAAAALTGISTSAGVASALLALLASQGGSPENAATVLGLSGLLLLAVASLQAGLRPASGRRRARRARPASATRDDEDGAMLQAAREQFLVLQAAWDAADLDTLRRLTTEMMYEELAAQLPERGKGPNRTDVLALEAQLISRDAIGPLELVGIEFSGVVRESAELGAKPFREVWMLARDDAEGHWRLARQQALI
jgi:hypothetical protein